MTAPFALPSEVEQALYQLRDQISDTSWALGDIAHIMVEEFPGVPAARIHGKIAAIVGLKGEAVKGRARVAAFYPERVRSQFEQLSFSHFREAMRLGSLENAERALRWAVETADDYGGSLASVAVLSQYISELLEDEDKKAEARLTLTQRVEAEVEEIRQWLMDLSVENADMVEPCRTVSAALLLLVERAKTIEG